MDAEQPTLVVGEPRDAAAWVRERRLAPVVLEVTDTSQCVGLRQHAPVLVVADGQARHTPPVGHSMQATARVVRVAHVAAHQGVVADSIDPLSA